MKIMPHTRTQKDKWKMSAEDRHQLNEERVKADRAYIVKILARRNIRDRTLGPQESPDPPPTPGCDDRRIE
jgi:hypothetical protein